MYVCIVVLLVCVYDLGMYVHTSKVGNFELSGGRLGSFSLTVFLSRRFVFFPNHDGRGDACLWSLW